MINISFIIPAYNENKYLEKCLINIKTLSEKNLINFEIIVIDNGSTDNTVDLAKKYTDLVYSIERNSVSKARNVGVSKASHEIIAFIDADVVLTISWFRCLLANYEEYMSDLNFIAGYQYAVREKGTWIEKYWFKNIKDKFFSGGNILTSKVLFNSISGFDEKLKTSEDYDFCQRSIAIGANYLANDGYEAIHEGYPRDLTNFFKREFWHGEGDYRTFSSFIRSITAVLGIIYLIGICLLIVTALTQSMAIFQVVLIFLLVINLIVTLKRFMGASLLAISANFIINIVYFIARGMSLFKAIKNRNFKY